MVRQHRFISARASTAWTRNLYGIRASRKTINNQLLSRVNCAYSPIKKLLLIANHHRLRLKWAQGWQNLTMAHWQHVIFGDESRFQFYLVDGRLVVCRLPGERFQHKGARLIGYKLVMVGYTSGVLFTVVQNRPLSLSTDTSLGSSTGAYCETT